MDQPLYDVIFSGQLVEGIDTETAKNNLATLFKTTPANVEKIFSGKPQPLKRGIDKAQALKYKAALHKAGLLVSFRPQQSASEAAPPTSSPVEQPKENVPAPTPQPEPAAAEEDWSLAPTGSDLLKANEKQPVAEVSVDTSNIKMVSAFMEPEPEVKELPPAPDTTHISVAAAGEDLLIDKPDAPPPLPLDLDDITLAPPGSDLEQISDDLPPLDPDTSSISMADLGADILEGQVKPAPPPAPNTDHISVANND